ncbi:OsmC family protein [Actinotalea sp.]|uniref:OsmC family protein n=1 Tax=Actinotalea sp. TaxID=1872145 RepID=UPI003561F930
MTTSADDGARTDGLPPGQAWVGETGTGRFAHEVRAGRHVWTADEPASVGGDDAGPGPFDMLLAALASCTSMTLRMYAERKGWPVERIAVRALRERVQVPSASGSGTPVMEDRFTCEVELVGDLDEQQRERMRQIADRCPVHRTLERGAVLETTLVPAGE